MNAKHTPAPWNVDTYGDVQANGEDVARIASGYEHAAADAALIAAAPDLLDVLQRLERMGKVPKVSPLGKRARAALAKALQVPPNDKVSGGETPSA